MYSSRDRQQREQQRIDLCRLRVIDVQDRRRIKTRATAITPWARRQPLRTPQEYPEEQRIRQPQAYEQDYQQRRNYERQQEIRRRQQEIDRIDRIATAEANARAAIDAQLQAMREQYPRVSAREAREAREAAEKVPTDHERFKDMAAYIRRYNNGLVHHFDDEDSDDDL